MYPLCALRFAESPAEKPCFHSLQWQAFPARHDPFTLHLKPELEPAPLAKQQASGMALEDYLVIVMEDAVLDTPRNLLWRNPPARKQFAECPR